MHCWLPIDFYTCFISYSSRDQQFVERLHADLQANGIRCWFAPRDLKIGDKIRSQVNEVIRIHEKLILVLSESSISSHWMEQEVERVMERESRMNRTVLLPVRLDDAVMMVKSGWAGDIRRTRHVGDITQWRDHDSYNKALSRLIRDLQAGIEG